MDSSTPKVLPAQSVTVFSGGIDLVLSRWSALQTAVENEWGGRDSRLKAQQIANDVLSWFIHSRESLYVDDLENILDEGMLSLNVEIDDGSVEEVAEKLMIIHEECLEGNFKSIEDLREANVKQPTHPQVPPVVDDSDEDNEVGERMGINGYNNSSSMMVDVPQLDSNSNQVTTTIDEIEPKEVDGGDDEWTVVSSRRNRGRRN